MANQPTNQHWHRQALSKDAEPLDSRTRLEGLQDGTVPLEDGLVASSKAVLIQPSNPTPRYLHKRTEGLCHPTAYTHMSKAALVTEVPNWKYPSVGKEYPPNGTLLNSQKGKTGTP